AKLYDLTSGDVPTRHDLLPEEVDKDELVPVPELLSEDNTNDVSKAFGPEDNSWIAKILRGEIKVEDGDEPPKEHPSYWESASMNPLDGRIVRVVNGTNKFVYHADVPKYDEIVEKVKEKFPELGPGK